MKTNNQLNIEVEKLHQRLNDLEHAKNYFQGDTENLIGKQVYEQEWLGTIEYSLELENEILEATEVEIEKLMEDASIGIEQEAVLKDALDYATGERESEEGRLTYQQIRDELIENSPGLKNEIKRVTENQILEDINKTVWELKNTRKKTQVHCNSF